MQANHGNGKGDKMTEATNGITRSKTHCAFFKNGTCSRTLLTVLDEEFGQPMKLEELATDPLAGGMMQGYQCGMIWGASLAAGAEAHRRLGPGPEAETKAMLAAQKLVTAFRAQNLHIDCIDITETDPNNTWQTIWHFFIKGGTFRCASRAADYAPVAFDAIDGVLVEEHRKSSCNPAGCAAKMARRMGASEKHAIMAAGLAGGIGMSGGGCGALGAAIWLIGLKGREEGVPNKVIKTRISDAMEKFQKNTDYEFECAEIVGRKFTDIEDHSNYIRKGGCAKLIEALAAAAAPEGQSAPMYKEAV